MIFLKLGPGQLTSVQPLDRSFAPPWCTAQRPELHGFQPPIRGQGRCSLGWGWTLNQLALPNISASSWESAQISCLICGGFWQSHKPYRVKPGSRHPLKKVPGFGSLPSGLGIAIGHIDADHVDARHLRTPWSTHSYNEAEFWSGPAPLWWFEPTSPCPGHGCGGWNHILDQWGKWNPWSLWKRCPNVLIYLTLVQVMSCGGWIDPYLVRLPKIFEPHAFVIFCRAATGGEIQKWQGKASALPCLFQDSRHGMYRINWSLTGK